MARTKKEQDNAEADYASACALTPSGYNVTSWMEEMDAQHTEIKAAMRELLAELKRCDESGEPIDYCCPQIVRAYDTVGVILVTQADIDEMNHFLTEVRQERKSTKAKRAAATRRSAAQKD